MIILDGKKIADQKKQILKQAVEQLRSQNKRIPKLVVLLVGDDQASKVYVAHKTRAANLVGIESEVLKFDQKVSKQELFQVIDRLNNDNSIDAILLQLPLPSQFDEESYLQAISVEKDVDGFHYINQGKMFQNYQSTFPCTPLGVINLLKAYNIKVEHKDITVVGTSNIVGKPLAIMLSNMGATVSMCNKNTTDISKYTKISDIVISATGKQFIITKEMIKKGAVVVDVGITRDLVTNKLVGDVDFENVQHLASYITPVPGGVGPMTVVTLLENTLKLYYDREKRK
ncbi:bifunctional 5,10-methylenetetrahydrofolate dehydrogenase/5,10-methenyltetrahydrofolate cyclohydrolase [Mycoplasma putrefaciens]|uniref:Bifunctional protein FolD n=1 Tax=Mycoplasma putrefaciens Mput9231 TaxID=1292033 RepID=M9WBN7_9MOLU|nr:bifunctional 5,10-methylenetetrahydrofolate dehydrogenase/5,10-methenyltetrahydrofolate cyclohydrolase [Mycoplasma putrefaciens]AGJ90557.1 Methylenetetrahydrofolate dehydrogenase (NADP+)/methenyltetrahydrofolate cyclohydrolase [Mycoplasma putrefaciens Mput9231]